MASYWRWGPLTWWHMWALLNEYYTAEWTYRPHILRTIPQKHHPWTNPNPSLHCLGSKVKTEIHSSPKSIENVLPVCGPSVQQCGFMIHGPHMYKQLSSSHWPQENHLGRSWGLGKFEIQLEFVTLWASFLAQAQQLQKRINQDQAGTRNFDWVIFFVKCGSIYFHFRLP